VAGAGVQAPVAAVIQEGVVAGVQVPVVVAGTARPTALSS
jgi:hypothetical protein